MARKTLRVTLLMHSWIGYLHGVLMGIAEYFEQRPDWIWTHILPIGQVPYGLDGHTDGVISHVEWPYAEELRKLRVPVINIGNWAAEPQFPQVLVDDEATGRLAGEYLLDLGLRNFGMVGMIEQNDPLFSQLRRKGFTQALAKYGLTADFAWNRKPAQISPPRVSLGVDERMLAWLANLPKPAGIFATHDNAAVWVLSACRYAGIKVPEEICVLGVDNDALIGRVSKPPLSSIELPTQKIGFEAARLLDSLMSGNARPTKPILLPPVGVVARQSTNLLAIADEDVLMSLRYIREHIHERVTVGSLLRAVPVNRRSLERKFAKHVGRTPLQEIHRVRLEKAKELLSGTDLSMPAIAKRAGFPNPERLANVFRAEAKMTPTEYRRQFRLVDL